ncbi:sensor histidine kinase efflux regulator BaeS [Dyella mobilis]|uniref:histidine kinase n=2 Tax=Dyella mobilis TaxID=1849582 RepID=A0ABS2KF26_9GAMM|nr:sensor histidine kinase efflux regulator BaeS [Dyella mobilis]
MLAVAVFAVLAMGVAARLSFDRGFLGYLSEQEAQRMESVASSLTAAYREHGSWDFLRENPRAWFEVMRPHGFSGGPFPDDMDHAPEDFGHGPPDHGPPGQPGQPPPLPPGDNGQSPQDHPGPPPGGPPGKIALSVSDLTGTALRFALLDAQQRFVFGNPTPTMNSPHTLKRAIVVDGKTVGWLTMLPFREVTEAGDVRFQQGQYRASWIIGTGALVLAILLAIWLARTLLTPVHEIAKATHALAKGDYASRVNAPSHDELGQLARDFNHLAVVLERNESMRREFVADISHELRTPLAIIRGELEALEDGVRRFDTDALASLQMEVGTLNKLIDDLYQLSLTDLGAMAYRKTDVDLGRLVASITEAFQERLRKAGIVLELRLPATPIAVYADEGRLHQLFANLIENSLRYTYAGGCLRIEAAVRGDRVAVDLMDSAPGVDEQNLPRLFERFYRVESSRNRSHGGAGLGLAICRAIVQAHGGSIEAKASPLGGLWLSIQLPREGS